MVNDRTVTELESFLADRADELMRTAVLLAGSRDAGQDLLQTALERIVPCWSRLDGDPEAYLRRVLYNLAADGFRRRGTLQRKLLLLRPVTEPSPDPTAEVDLRDALVRLMLKLPARQRAVLVLRFWEQLTEAEAAAVLGWPEGTVKSATARGLQRLRELTIMTDLPPVLLRSITWDRGTKMEEQPWASAPTLRPPPLPISSARWPPPSPTSTSQT